MWASAATGTTPKTDAAPGFFARGRGPPWAILSTPRRFFMTGWSRTLGIPALAALCVLFAVPARAQVTGTGIIEVIVLDATGAPIPGVTVTASAPDVTTKRSGVTDASGKATVLGRSEERRVGKGCRSLWVSDR